MSNTVALDALPIVLTDNPTNVPGVFFITVSVFVVTLVKVCPANCVVEVPLCVTVSDPLTGNVAPVAGNTHKGLPRLGTAPRI